MIRQLSAAALLAPALALAMTATAHAGTPRVDQRQDHQEARIAQGVNSGELTAREMRTLAAQQARIAAHEARAKADGVVTVRERASLHAQQDHASRAIYRKKHNERDRG
jgi:hypothetical protein